MLKNSETMWNIFTWCSSFSKHILGTNQWVESLKFCSITNLTIQYNKSYRVCFMCVPFSIEPTCGSKFFNTIHQMEDLSGRLVSLQMLACKRLHTQQTNSHVHMKIPIWKRYCTLNTFLATLRLFSSYSQII